MLLSVPEALRGCELKIQRLDHDGPTPLYNLEWVAYLKFNLRGRARYSNKVGGQKLQRKRTNHIARRLMRMMTTTTLLRPQVDERGAKH